MRNLVESILNKDFTKANDYLHEELKIIVARKLNEAKKMLAAKVSVGEQFGNTRTLSSVELAKRGLAEGDVVPFEKNKTSSPTSPKVHVGNQYVAVDHGDSISFHKNDGGKPGKSLGPLGKEGSDAFRRAHEQFKKEIGFTPDSDVGKITPERAVDWAVNDTMKRHSPDMDAPPKVTKLKEDAKRAALSIVGKLVKEEKIHNEKGEHIGDVMGITGTHAKNPTKTVKKFRAEKPDDKHK
jgi:hypothetical protein